MNLRTKHILAVSAVAGIAGVIGYLIGHKVGFEKGYIFGTPEIEEEETESDDEKVFETMDSTLNFFGINKISKKQLEELKAMSVIDRLKTLCDMTGNYYQVVEKDDGSVVVCPTRANPQWTTTDEDGQIVHHPVEPWLPEYVRLKANGIFGDSSDKEDEELHEMKNHIKDYISDDEDAEEDTDDEEELENIRTQGEVEYTSSEPYLVTEDEVYGLEAVPDDIESLTYYKADDVLADSFDEIVTERDLVLGPTIEEIRNGSDEVSEYFVRNPHTRRDYEVIVNGGSYEQEVLGADDEQYRNAVKYFNLGDDE